jgi:hypothetical protein
MVMWTSPPVPAGGPFGAPSIDIARTKPRATLGGDRRDDARAAELQNLRLALATFALQLEAFELQARGGLLKAGIRPAMPAPPLAPVAGARGEEMIGGQ